ncbi:acyl-CoA dehydrogenase, partial [mine drainage metagenome]
NLVVDSIFRNGSEHIRKSFLPRLSSGEMIASLCLTEPASGSDALAMKTEPGSPETITF